MKRFFLLLLFCCSVFLGNVSPTLGATPVERQYLLRLHPHVKRFWDGNVILLSDMLLQKNHSFNNKGLVVSIEINISAKGKVTSTGLVASSGNDLFDDTALDAASSLAQLPPPPRQLLSDDGTAHIFWTLKRVKPYSSLALASVRRVRFATPVAISKFIQQGLYSLALKRLISDSATAGYTRSNITTFISQAFFKLWGGAEMERDVLNHVLSMTKIRALDAALFVPFAALSKNDAHLRALLPLLSASQACTLLTSLSLTSSRGALVALHLLRNRQRSCFVTQLKSRLKKEPSSPIHLLLAGDSLRSNPSQAKFATSLSEALKGAQAHWALLGMGLAGGKTFLHHIKHHISKGATPQIRAAAVHALGDLTDKAAGFLLLNSLRSKDTAVIQASIDTIPRFRGPDMKKVWKFCIWELGNLMKKHSSLSVRAKAAHAVITLTQTDLKNDDHKHYFFLALKNTNAKVLLGAIAGLSPKTLYGRKKLLIFSAHSNAKIRAAAARQLLQVSTDAAVKKRLLALSTDPSPLVRAQVSMFETRLSILKNNLHSSSPVVAVFAARQLTLLAFPWVTKNLLRLLESKLNKDRRLAFVLATGLYAKATR